MAREPEELASLGAYEFSSGTSPAGDARHVQLAKTTANLFEVWGLGVEAGRLFQPGEDAPGRPRVGILSHRSGASSSTRRPAWSARHFFSTASR